MATTEADERPPESKASGAGNFPAVRRLEAVGFRAWPAGAVRYDGSWQVRLTEGHPSKRLNCVVPLDPSDYRDLDTRMEKAAERFKAYGRPLVIRETPLTPPPLLQHLRALGWSRFEDVRVMTADLAAVVLPDTMDHLPSHDVARFASASVKVEGSDPMRKPVLAGIVSAIKPPSGLFVIEDGGEGAVATALCVQDNDLTGIVSLAVAQTHRRRGLGVEILASALRWARMRGARTAWLQVVAANQPAIALYERLGFRDVYHYHYWREGGQS